MAASVVLPKRPLHIGKARPALDQIGRKTDEAVLVGRWNGLRIIGECAREEDLAAAVYLPEAEVGIRFVARGVLVEHNERCASRMCSQQRRTAQPLSASDAASAPHRLLREPVQNAVGSTAVGAYEGNERPLGRGTDAGSPPEVGSLRERSNRVPCDPLQPLQILGHRDATIVHQRALLREQHHIPGAALERGQQLPLPSDGGQPLELAGPFALPPEAAEVTAIGGENPEAAVVGHDHRTGARADGHV